MKTFIKFPLNLQLFAEDNGAGGTGGNEPTPPVPSVPTTQQNIDYGKIEEIVNKRSASTADNALKGILKEQGLSGEELNQAIAAYKTQKEQATMEKETELANTKAENARLNQQIIDGKIEVKLTSLASTEGVSNEKLPFLLKLVERKDLVDEKGEVVEDKVKEALSTVLAAFPDFKTSTQQQGGFQQIGASGNDTGTKPDASVAAFQNGRIVLPKK